MDATLHALGQLLIEALPTFFIVLVLHYYLKSVFFRPLARVLAERTEATEGARKHAAEALERANARAAEYEQQIRDAKNEIYREQEEQRKRWSEEYAAQLADSRHRAEAKVGEAKAQLAEDAEQAKLALSGEAQQLADRITGAILQGRHV